MRGLFVTGTDTGVGKSVLSACLLAAMAAEGEPVRAFKPVVTGVQEPPEPGGWPPDHELLGAAARMPAGEVSPLLFGPAVSPHLAAELAGTEIDTAGLLAAARAAADGHTLVAEGVGGLLVPLSQHTLVRDLAAALGLPLVIAARPGLGTINHSLLTIEAARASGLRVAAVVLTPWPLAPGAMELSNRDTIARVGSVEVHCLGEVPAARVEQLARAGAQLPWRRWVGESQQGPTTAAERRTAGEDDPGARV